MNNQLSVSELEYIVSRVLDNAKTQQKARISRSLLMGKNLHIMKYLIL